MIKIKNLNTEIIDVFGNSQFLDEKKTIKLTLLYAIIGALNVRHDSTTEEENLLNGELVYKFLEVKNANEIEVSLDSIGLINKAVKKIYNPFITAQIVRLISEGIA